MRFRIWTKICGQEGQLLNVQITKRNSNMNHNKKGCRLTVVGCWSELLLREWERWAPLLFLNRERELTTHHEVDACRRN
jgi:hypothetical protein